MATSRSAAEIQKIVDEYGQLEDVTSVQRLREDFKNKRGPVYDVILQRYRDGQSGGELSDVHIQRIKDDMHMNDIALRYAAYTGMAARCARYLAYTSDFGEAFRPMAHPMMVRLTYAISWGYVVGDVSLHGYDMNQRHDIGGMDLMFGVTKRAIFQAMASMALPAVTIHSTVKYSKVLLKKMNVHKVWGPTACGLAVVPFLPWLYDHPVEFVCDFVFDSIYTPSKKLH